MILRLYGKWNIFLKNYKGLSGVEKKVLSSGSIKTVPIQVLFLWKWCCKFQCKPDISLINDGGFLSPFHQISLICQCTICMIHLHFTNSHFSFNHFFQNWGVALTLLAFFFISCFKKNTRQNKKSLFLKSFIKINWPFQWLVQGGQVAATVLNCFDILTATMIQRFFWFFFALLWISLSLLSR